MSLYKEQLKEMLAEIEISGHSCLSIGAQFDDRKYFKSCDFKHYLTLDNDEQFAPDVLFSMNKPVTDDELDGDFPVNELKDFDAVLALNLWEYIYDPMTAHRNIYQFLKEGGLYMGSYVFVYGKHNPPNTDYLRYTDDGIRKLLTQAYFKDIEIKEIKCNDLLTSFYQAEGMRIRKDLDHNVAGYLVTARK